jgi:hypothetical protein
MGLNGKDFEDEVRRIARLLWPSAEFGGAAMEDGKERDGVFETEEFLHIIECTTSKSKAKAESDVQKLQSLTRKIGARNSQKFIKAWFITQEEPTAEQRTVVRGAQGRIVTVSFEQFRSRLVDAKSYLSLRENYPFGSVRDPETGAARTSLDYVPLDILGDDGATHSAEDISRALLSGRRFVLLGDYGAGKSASLREVFFKLCRLFRAGKSLLFPIAVNLRDHHGQTDPVEALERHARRIGFPRPADLVRAWRAGFGILLLDGFDEIATAGWAGKTKTLGDLRYKSMELIRAFLRESPQAGGILLAGRAHFFDSTKEVSRSLGIDSQFTTLNVSEFNEDQVKTYLAKEGWTDPIPEWIPSRPLLLGYLASRKLLQRTLEVDAGSGPAVGWNALLRRICEREAEIEAGIDPETVRRLLAYLATIARDSTDGLGPLSPEQITSAFSSVCGYPPDDRGMVLLQRLPGLGGHNSQDSSRVFIDKDFAETARAALISDFIDNPYAQDLDSRTWQSSLFTLGAEVAAHRAAGLKPGKMTAALLRASELSKGDTLCADLVLIMVAAGASYDGPNVFLKDVLIPQLDLDVSSDLRSVEFQDCIFSSLELQSDISVERLPRFVRCYFGEVCGRTGPADMPAEVFIDCIVDTFDNVAQTTKDILGLELPLSTKVLLTVLKKLFAQRGSGRRESALYRGLDARSKELVPRALALLRKHGFAVRTRQSEKFVWLPTKSSEYRRRALSALAAPNASQDPLLLESFDL